MNVKTQTKTKTTDLPEGYESRLNLPINYMPSEKEEYMCEQHLEYFRRKLWYWRADLIEESQQTIDNLKSEVRDVGDLDAVVVLDQHVQRE